MLLKSDERFNTGIDPSNPGGGFTCGLDTHTTPVKPRLRPLGDKAGRGTRLTDYRNARIINLITLVNYCLVCCCAKLLFVRVFCMLAVATDHFSAGFDPN
jgi:hypothetical protein